MAPIIKMSSSGTHGAGGVGCCCFRCCTCIHVEFFKSLPGIIKVCETVISGLIQSLLINYGLRYSSKIGSAFEGSLTTASACFLTSALLLACYTISEKSYKLIRSSFFEVMFNSLACFLYLSSSSYLAFATKLFLMTEYYLIPGFDVYPAMTAAYILSGVVGVLHGADAYLSFVHYKTGR
ncbi:protein singles bar [Solenopsis invicta]|uniref:protein singles bar n=1 Tax=Solenopsis invicta TaxID=13686 RepID=UPI000595BA17|nr:protein singles bar [Solenopsis invicta]XP_039310940.1 protein singles bar [Solenopsis invicta]